MSIEIVKSGILDTIQDGGRNGLGHLGINPNGPMSWYDFQMANALAGNPLNEPAIEMHFPAPVIRFHKPAVIGIAGGNWRATVNDNEVAPNRTIAIPANSVLKFTQKICGERLYLSVRGGFGIDNVLGSASTHLKASFGGWQGRALKKGDELHFRNELMVSGVKMFPWFAPSTCNASIIKVMPGPEWEWLTAASQTALWIKSFELMKQSDRMAIRLSGVDLEQVGSRQLVSTPVVMGSVQLLPSRHLLVLMADHQTVGGYPRVLQVSKADLPKLAQKSIHQIIRFQYQTVNEAQAALAEEMRAVQKLASSVRMNLSGVIF